MIDTVCLLIPKSEMVFLAGISSWQLYSQTEQYKKYVRNPSKAEKDTGRYFPRLTGYNRRFSQDANVRIEFSVPKLVYLNNLEELEDKDFPLVIDELQERLKMMGVVVKKSVLENAPVSSVHFSRNLLLEDGYTVNHLISEMNKIDLRKSFDFAKARYINDGQSLYAHTNSHEMVIYDKVLDLGKDKKRAIDKTQTLYQRNLFSEIVKSDKPTEIIRFEIRLNQKQKMGQVLEKLGYKKNPTFREVFNSTLSQKVLLEYWNTLIKERNLGLLSLKFSLKDMLRTLLLVNKKIKPKQAIYLIGLLTLANDENGMRELRSIISRKPKDRTWHRISKDMRNTSETITRNKVKSWVTQIDNKLKDYKPYKTKKYEEI